MNTYIKNQHTSLPYRLLSSIIIITFAFTSVVPPKYSYAQSVLNLPIPGQTVSLTNTYFPAVIKGVKIFPDNPLRFDFIMDTGDTAFQGDDLKKESTKLIKYFLASLTIPEEDLWVNLSPYEKDRIIPEAFGQTEMGRDLLAQDYLLKQLTASLMYPKNELGQKFWERVYEKAQQEYGTSDIPFDTFNKVWIVPEKAIVYEKDDVAFVVESRLKVMLEEDYILTWDVRRGTKEEISNSNVSRLTSNVLRSILIPEIEKEINEGENFAQLRQIYHSIILAAWYKQVLQKSLLGKIYVDQNKIKGVDIEDKDIKQKIYQQYLEAFKKGVYNYIREEYDPNTQSIIPRKYFSGGAVMQVTRMAGSPILEVYKYNENFDLKVVDAIEDYLTKEPHLKEIEVRLIEPSEKISPVSSPAKQVINHKKKKPTSTFRVKKEINTAMNTFPLPILKTMLEMVRIKKEEKMNQKNLFISKDYDNWPGIIALYILVVLANFYPFTTLVIISSLGLDLDKKSFWQIYLATAFLPTAWLLASRSLIIRKMFIWPIDVVRRIYRLINFPLTYARLSKEYQQSSTPNPEYFYMQLRLQKVFGDQDIPKKFLLELNEGITMISSLKDIPQKWSRNLMRKWMDYFMEQVYQHKPSRGLARFSPRKATINFLRQYGFNVQNQTHGFVEIHVEDYGWVHVDLGGGGDPANYDYGNKPQLQEVEQPRDFREADTENYKEQQESKKQDSGETQKGKGQDGGESQEGKGQGGKENMGGEGDSGEGRGASSPVSVSAEKKEVGGIDFSADILNLQIKRNGQGIPLPVEMQDIENIHIQGLIPIIINITPMNNLPTLLGFDTKSPNELTPSEEYGFFDSRCPDVPSSEPTDGCVESNLEVLRRRDNVTGSHQYQVAKG